jgi:hypothetical protein
VADINERLDRLHRREAFDQRVARLGAVRPPEPDEPAPPRTAPLRPAGVDDRLGEVLDAVAGVVRRHPGLSVMVAVADERPGRPVIRVTERGGDVETGVVVPGTEPFGIGPDVATPEPAAGAQAGDPEGRRRGGRHAAPADHDDEARDGGRARRSWHYSLWSADRAAAPPDPRPEHSGLRLVRDLPEVPDVPDPEPADQAGTSQVVSRLAQLLREDPGLVSSWGREAPER